jgi:hypothetical protein
MAVSLDGYIAGPGGQFDWSIPDEELMRSTADEGRQVGVQLMGRKLYQTMLYRETVDQASLDDSDLEWIAIWKPLPKVGVLRHAAGGAGQRPAGLRRRGGGDRAVASRAGGRAT